jgi:hypothetical protein
MEPKMIPIDAIKLDNRAQPRVSTFLTVVEEYEIAMQEGAEFPPLTVFFDGADYWLADGFHRYYAYKGRGVAEVWVDVHNGTVRDAILHSCGVNDKHGLRRSIDDKRRAVFVMLRDEEWAKWSDRGIAQQCHVTHPFVGKLKAEMAARTGNVTSTDRTFTHWKTGQQATMHTANIGKGERIDAAPHPGDATDDPKPMTREERHRAFMDSWREEMDRGAFVEHALSKIREEIDKMPQPTEAIEIYPPSFRYLLDTEAIKHLRHCGRWLLDFCALAEDASKTWVIKPWNPSDEKEEHDVAAE